MPLEGEYAPSPWDWSREQADKIAESGGTEGTDMKGMPVILLTTVGAKSGKLRKTPLMGDEKAVWWERAVAAYPDYADYQTKTDRQIPVFLLTPVQ
jgi:hypothetical protein